MQIKALFWTFAALNLLFLSLVFLPAFSVINESWLTAKALPDICLEEIDSQTTFVFCEAEVE